MENPKERFYRRMMAEVPPLRKKLQEKIREIEEELDEAQRTCSPHIDDGGMFEGFCTKCGIGLG